MKTYGYTAQFVTIAIALRIALVEYYDRVAIIEKKSALIGNEELEARRLTIILLTASLFESCINTALALSLAPADYKKIERKPPREKWLVHSRLVNPAFALDPHSALGRELDFIFECRNSTTHAQPEVYSERDTIHPGNHSPWGLLTHERVLPIVTALPNLLFELCSGAEPLVASMSSDVSWQLRLKQFQKGEPKQPSEPTRGTES